MNLLTLYYTQNSRVSEDVDLFDAYDPVRAHRCGKEILSPPRGSSP